MNRIAIANKLASTTKKITSLGGLLMILLLAVYGCSGQQAEEEEATEQEETTEETSQDFVQIKTTALELDMPAEIPSGWTTFKYFNLSSMTHFFLMEKMPIVDGEQMTVEDHKELIVPVFQAVMDSLISGGEPPYDQLPEWFGEVQFLGGSGLTGPGKTSTTTINLQPGTYAVECYVKNPGGVFHSAVGMITGVVVTEETTGNSAPEATLNITLSSEGGIQAPENIEAGTHTVAVTYQDQKVLEHFLGFDLHLARLEDASAEEVGAWMNWMPPEGLQVPAPAVFLGGTQEMPAGSTIYFTVDITEGRYAWVSEVPDPAARNMLKVFEVGGGM